MTTPLEAISEAESTRIEAALIEKYGERCEDFDPACATCLAWAELQRLTDPHILALRSSGAVKVKTDVGTTLNFFASVIKSGEPWTATCQREFDKAHAALSSIEPAEQEPVAAMDGEIDMLFAGLRRDATPDNTLRLDRLQALYASPEAEKVTVTDEMVERVKVALRAQTKKGTHHSERIIRIILTSALTSEQSNG